MKELEIYKAEILRRSEEKIKKCRQNRKRLILCCIPVCLCAVIGAAVWLSGTDSAESEMATQDLLPESAMESVMASTTAPFQSVQIRDWTGKTTVVEERAKVGKLYQAITDRYAAADANATENKIKEYSFAEDRTGAMWMFAESVPGYEIQFTTDSGETRCFRFWLDGWLMENGDLDKSVFLSPEQVEELKALLTEG